MSCCIFHCFVSCVHIWLLRYSYILGLTLPVRAEMVGKYVGDYSVVTVFTKRMFGGVNKIPNPWPSYWWLGIHHLLGAPVLVGHGSLWSTLSEISSRDCTRPLTAPWLTWCEPNFRENLLLGPAKVDKTPQCLQPQIILVFWGFTRDVDTNVGSMKAKSLSILYFDVFLFCLCGWTQ